MSFRDVSRASGGLKEVSDTYQGVPRGFSGLPGGLKGVSRNLREFQRDSKDFQGYFIGYQGQRAFKRITMGSRGSHGFLRVPESLRWLQGVSGRFNGTNGSSRGSRGHF